MFCHIWLGPPLLVLRALLTAASLTSMETDVLLATIRDGSLTRDAAQALTLGQLTARNASGGTALHGLAKYGRLRDLAPNFLTPSLLTLKNDSG